jgi:hypothetical protein
MIKTAAKKAKAVKAPPAPKAVAKKAAPKAAPAPKAVATAPAPVAAPAKAKAAAVGNGVEETVGPNYREGSANQVVYAILSDGEIHTLQEVYEAAKATGAKYERDALWNVGKDGNKYGWTVVKDKANGTVQMQRPE